VAASQRAMACQSTCQSRDCSEGFCYNVWNNMVHVWGNGWNICDISRRGKFELLPSLPSETLSKWQSLKRMLYFTLKYLVHKISGPVKCQSGFKVCCFMSPHQLKSKFYMKYFICHFSFQIVTTKVGVLLGLHLAKCKLCCDFVD